MFRLTLLSILLIFSVSAQAQELNKESAYFKIYEAAQKAKNKDAAGIRVLYKMSL